MTGEQTMVNFTKETISLISRSVKIEGEIKQGTNIEIEGEIKGNISNVENLTIRECGKVYGDVKCKVLNIKGVFSGKAIAEKINISDVAKVNGILEYKFLSADYGADINCELKRINGDIKSVDFDKKVADVKVANAK